MQRAEKRNFRTVPLSEITQEQREEISCLYRSESESGYLESVLAEEQGSLPEELNFVTLRGEEVAAFCLISASDGDCMLRYLCANPKLRNSVAMLLPLIRSVDAFKESEYRNLRWTVKSDNLYSGNLMERRFPEIQPRTELYSYLWEKSE